MTTVNAMILLRENDSPAIPPLSPSCVDVGIARAVMPVGEQSKGGKGLTKDREGALW
jgi:hypothetical protein